VPDNYTCAWTGSPGGACHFEYLPAVAPHRENCYGCIATTAGPSRGYVCEPNLPTVPMSGTLPNVLIVGDSISHGYFPVLSAAITGTVAQLQHAPSNTGTLAAGLDCWNITTLLGASGALPKPWDLVVFNFGLHDTDEPTPPPMRTIGAAVVPTPASSHSVANNMTLLRQYTEAGVLRSGRVRRGLRALTTPYMAGGVWRTLELMNANASAYMASVGIPEVDLWTPIVKHCGPLPYAYCDICSGSTPGHPVAANFTPHYTAAGYALLVQALVPAIKHALSQ